MRKCVGGGEGEEGRREGLVWPGFTLIYVALRNPFLLLLPLLLPFLLRGQSMVLLSAVSLSPFFHILFLLSALFIICFTLPYFILLFFLFCYLCPFLKSTVLLCAVSFSHSSMSCFSFSLPLFMLHTSSSHPFVLPFLPSLSLSQINAPS